MSAARRIVNRLAQILSMTRDVKEDDHATDPREPWMTMICDGRRVKL